MRYFKCTWCIDEIYNSFTVGNIYKYEEDGGKFFCNRNRIWQSNAGIEDILMSTSNKYMFVEVDGLGEKLCEKAYLLCTEVDGDRCTRDGATRNGSTYFIANRIYIHENNALRGENGYEYRGSCASSIVDLSVYFKFRVITESEYTEMLNSDDYIAAILSSDVEQMILNEKKKLEERIKTQKRNIRDYKDGLENAFKDMKVTEASLKNFVVDSEYKDKILTDVRNIKAHQFVKNLKFENGLIVIDTNCIYAFEPYTSRYYKIGEMEFKIPLRTDENVSMFNLTKTTDAYGSCMQTPHIFSNGEACWGNAGSQVVTFLATKEYYALFVTLLNFCQSVDIDDCAGWCCCAWEEVDSDHKHVRDGHAPENDDEYDGHGCCDYSGEIGGGGEDNCHHTCAECGERFYEDDMYYCEDCDQWFCEDHAGYYEELERSICNGCRDRYYTECDDCGELIRNQDANAETFDGNILCDNCAEEKYNICEDCGKYMNSDDTEEVNGSMYCPNCIDAHREEDEEEIEISEENLDDIVIGNNVCGVTLHPYADEYPIMPEPRENREDFGGYYGTV